MTEKPDLISRINGFAEQLRVNESGMRAKLGDLSDRLIKSCSGITVSASSETVTLRAGNFDVSIIGYMLFDTTSGLEVAWRSTDEDPNDPSYSVKSLNDCPVDWLVNLLRGDNLSTLLESVGSQLQSKSETLNDLSRTIQQLANNPSSTIASTFESTAQTLGYGQAIDDWRKAQDVMHTDPSSAISRATTLLETVLKHILADLSLECPADQSLQPLMKAVAKALDLAPANQAEADLRGLCQGLTSVVQNIGSLRTKFGDAHGRGPEHIALQSAHAQLAVNAAGMVATFVMERWNEIKQSKPC